MATDLYQQISAKYPKREVTIDVSEDGENGAVITWPADQSVTIN